MANVKISGLPAAATPLNGSELVPIVKSGVTSQVSVDNLTAGKSISVSTITVTGDTASGSGLVLAPQMVRLNADRQKTVNDTALEAIFDSTNDSLNLAANTLYYFKGTLFFNKTTSASSSTITLGFVFSNTQQDIAYGISANLSTTTSNIRSVIAGATNTTSSTGTAAYTSIVFIEGFFKSNATTGGTITPSFAQSVAGSSTAPSALAGSFIMIQPMSSNVNATILAGNWS